MYCNRILDQKYKYPKEETFPVEHQQCIQHLTLESDITSHLILKSSSQSLYSKQQDTLKRDLTIFSQIHEINTKYSFQQLDIIQLTSSTSTPSNSCLMTVVITFSDSWNNFFRIAIIADPAALILLDFLI